MIAPLARLMERLRPSPTTTLRGRIRPIVVVIKSLASSICIGTGGAVGREGPIVQIGSALGSTIGQWLRLSDDRLRNLVACGVAGGIQRRPEVFLAR